MNFDELCVIINSDSTTEVKARDILFELEKIMADQYTVGFNNGYHAGADDYDY